MEERPGNRNLTQQGKPSHQFRQLLGCNSPKTENTSAPYSVFELQTSFRKHKPEKNKYFGFKSLVHPILSLFIYRKPSQIHRTFIWSTLPKVSVSQKNLTEAAATAQRVWVFPGCSRAPSSPQPPPSFLSLLCLGRSLAGQCLGKGTDSLLLQSPAPAAARTGAWSQLKRKATPQHWHSQAPGLALGRETIPVSH